MWKERRAGDEGGRVGMCCEIGPYKAAQLRLAMEDFMAVTGISSEEEAIRWLSMCDFDSAQATELYLNSRDADSGHAVAQSQPGSAFADFNWADEVEVRRPDPVKRDRLLLNEEDGVIVTQSKKQRTVSVFGSGKGYVPKSAKEVELAAMFKPPTDIAFPGGLDEAKEHAASLDRWLLVNIQDETEFASHVLNRDFWSSEDIRSILECSFVLWQQLNISSEGILFIERYKVVDFPCIAILDPVTGACVLKLEGREKTKPATLGERIQDFLGDRATPSERTASARKPVAVVSATTRPNASSTEVYNIINDEVDGEEELQQALALSLMSSNPRISREPPTDLSSHSVPSNKDMTTPIHGTDKASTNTASNGINRDNNTPSASMCQGFSAKKILVLDLPNEDTTSADASKALQFRIRFPSGASVTTQLYSSSRLQTLLQFLAQRLPPESHCKTFDIFYGHPVKAVSELASAQKVPQEEITLEMIGLTVNTALTVRFL